MRNRLEDLGRLAEKLRHITEHELFNIVIGRKKDYSETFYECSKERQAEVLHSIAYGIEEVENMIHYCLGIAEATDDLNYNDVNLQ